MDQFGVQHVRQTLRLSIFDFGAIFKTSLSNSSRKRKKFKTENYYQMLVAKFLLMYSWLQKKTGDENFPNVNLVLSICQLIVYLTIPVK
jgi:hypothetical protein